jgi:preprotein translocase subunit SecA
MLDGLIKILFGSQFERDLKTLLPKLHLINEKEKWAVSLQAEDFPKKTE